MDWIPFRIIEISFWFRVIELFFFFKINFQNIRFSFLPSNWFCWLYFWLWLEWESKTLIRISMVISVQIFSFFLSANSRSIDDFDLNFSAQSSSPSHHFIETYVFVCFAFRKDFLRRWDQFTWVRHFGFATLIISYAFESVCVVSWFHMSMLQL